MSHVEGSIGKTSATSMTVTSNLLRRVLASQTGASEPAVKRMRQLLFLAVAAVIAAAIVISVVLSDIRTEFRLNVRSDFDGNRRLALAEMAMSVLLARTAWSQGELGLLPRIGGWEATPGGRLAVLDAEFDAVIAELEHVSAELERDLQHLGGEALEHSNSREIPIHDIDGHVRYMTLNEATEWLTTTLRTGELRGRAVQ